MKKKTNKILNINEKRFLMFKYIKIPAFILYSLNSFERKSFLIYQVGAATQWNSMERCEKHRR